jgi:putative ABC transport system permease protein
MFRNYFKIAIRNLARYRLFSFINLFGLALSMSICLLVILHVQEQAGYDRFHRKAGRITRVISDVTGRNGSSYHLASTPLPLGPSFKSDYGFVEDVVRVYPAQVADGVEELPLQGAFVDGNFFSVFGFRLAKGDPVTALRAPNSIVLSADAARKFFGSAQPVGRVLKVGLGTFLVTGVLEATDNHSHLDFEGYLSMNSVPALERSGQLPGRLDQWTMDTKAYTYLLLKPGTTKTQLNDALATTARAPLARSTLLEKEAIAFRGQPFSTIILGDELQNSLGNVGSFGKLAAEIVIGLIILLSACFNYTNLSIARSLSRSKEVGIRKVAGASRLQIFGQFVSESIFLSVLALVFAFVLVRLMADHAPFIQELGVPDLRFRWSTWGLFLAFAIFCGLLAGSLPAWLLSSFRPVDVLKSLATVKLLGGRGFRNVLTVIQFALALVITIFTTVAARQFRFLATADPGFTRSQIIKIPLQGADPLFTRAELSRVATVQSIAATSVMPGRNASGQASIRFDGSADPLRMDCIDVDGNFFDVMGLKLVAGTHFAGEWAGREREVVLNETALKPFHLSAAEAVGTMVTLGDSVRVRIAGVVRDFHFQGMAVQIAPLLFRNRPAAFRFLAVKTVGTDDDAMAGIRNAWVRIQPQTPFEGTWYAEALAERQGARGTVSMLGFLAFMSITIACLGLLGMVIYQTETRRKEIGIRKVMGASVAVIVRLLSARFLRLVLIAGLIALPLGYLLGMMFLQVFPTRVSPGLTGPLFAFVGLFFAALLTIGSQVVRMAKANPVRSLRSE